MIKKHFFSWLLMLTTNFLFAQDIAFAKKMVDTLTSPDFWGRGYTNDGMNKAARFLSEQFQSYGLQPLSGNNFFQSFSYPVNTFPGKMQVALDGKKLIPGRDFIVSPESSGKKAKGKLSRQDSTHFIDSKNRIILLIKDKLTWSVADGAADSTIILMDKKVLQGIPSSIRVNIGNKLVKDFKAANVCGIVKGTRKPDSIIVISAHYDHLGGMGENVYFPGANDNASGISMLLGLAKYYAVNPQPYSIAFIFFAGEEAGLLGSKYFTEHPLLLMENIRFLINIDMIGTGNEGITVVNGQQFSKEYSMLTRINSEGKYLSMINARGKAANSDHYWFTEKGVPAFFIYTLGGIRAYHDIFDAAATLPLNEYEDLFTLMIKFNAQLMK